MTTPLRWGIISTGGIAHTFARDLAFIESGVAVAVGSRSMESANTFADEFDIAGRYDSYEALVDDPEVEAVYVATPHPMHFDNAMLALERGKPVLVEKAFTVTAEQASMLVGVAADKKVFMMEAMWTRFLPHVIAIRELIADGSIGEIVTFEADHGKRFDYDPSSRFFNPALGGGAMLDLGVYPISFASMLLGPPAKIMAVVDPAPTGVDMADSMIFGYENGAHALINTTMAARTSTRASISGTKARIEIEGDFYSPGAFSLITPSGEVRRFEFATQGRGLHYEAAEVARCVRSGLLESPLMPLHETVEIMTTMEAVLAMKS
jgi:predicted dehydrogenase